MRSRRRIYLCMAGLLVLLSAMSVHAGNIDSLLSIVRTGQNDTTKLRTLTTLTREYNDIGKLDSAIQYGNEALKLADLILSTARDKKTIELSTKLKGGAHVNLSLVCWDQGNFAEALQHDRSALVLYEKVDYKRGIAYTFNSMGLVHMDQGNYVEALNSFFASLKIKEELGDKRGIANSYGNIGIVYTNQKRYDLALKNLSAALKVGEEINDKKMIANQHANLGNVYNEKKNFGLAVSEYLSALGLYELLGDKVGIAQSHNNLGLVYAQLGNYPEAMRSYTTSLAIKEEIGHRPGIASTCMNLGDLYFKLKNYAEAEKYAIKGKKVAEETGYREHLVDAYNLLYSLDSARGNYRGYFENYKKMILQMDSLNNEEIRKKTMESQMTYDFEKKEAIAKVKHLKEVEKQQVLAMEKSRKQNLVIGFGLTGVSAVIIFGAFVFRSLRITRKQKSIMEIQKLEAEDQKQELENQKFVLEEKQKAVIDSINYAKRIQSAQMASERYIEMVLLRLKR